MPVGWPAGRAGPPPAIVPSPRGGVPLRRHRVLCAREERGGAAAQQAEHGAPPADGRGQGAAVGGHHSGATCRLQAEQVQHEKDKERALEQPQVLLAPGRVQAVPQY